MQTPRLLLQSWISFLTIALPFCVVLIYMSSEPVQRRRSGGLDATLVEADGVVMSVELAEAAVVLLAELAWTDRTC